MTTKDGMITKTPTVIVVALIALLGLTAVASAAQANADSLVRQLGDLPSSLEIPVWGGSFNSNALEDSPLERLNELFRQIHDLGDPALPALSRALGDPDVHLRRNVAFFLMMAGIAHLQKTELAMDVRPCLLALTAALGDADQYVRSVAAQTIALVGPDAAPAVPALVAFLKSGDAARSSACSALGNIGAGAREALPALTDALSDPDAQVRRQAQTAISKIQNP
jgi:HEAT repeat protein